MKHPLKNEQWEPKHPLDTYTARLMLCSVRELFLTRVRYTKTIEAGRKPYRDLEERIAEDVAWVLEGRGQEPYTLHTFCDLYGIKVIDFQRAYIATDIKRFAYILHQWDEDYGCTV